jgi:hypothetical protein
MLMTGKEYLDSIRDGRRVYVGGELVEDVTTHPAFSNAARSFAMIYDRKRNPDNRVLGHAVDAKWSEPIWRAGFDALRTGIATDLAKIGLGDLHAQDLQNCLCEFDKYLRVKLSEGKPRRRFRPTPPTLFGEAAE